MSEIDSSSSALEELRKLMATPELPELGPGPRMAVLPLAVLEQKLDDWLPRSMLPAAAQAPIRAAVLLWHDHLHASHRISQDLSGPDGSYLHGLMHRREPDYGNSKYWFHRVGRHSCFVELARRAGGLLRDKSETALERRLMPRGDWDPFTFIDACEAKADAPASDTHVQLLRAIQAIEFELLLNKFCQTRGD